MPELTNEQKTLKARSEKLYERTGNPRHKDIVDALEAVEKGNKK